MSRQQRRRHQDRDPNSQLSVFPSELGWFGLVGATQTVTALTFGHRDPGNVHARLQLGKVITREQSPVDWWPELRARLQAYASGEAECFGDVTIDLSSATPFEKAVRTALRQVRFGETVSYAKLAERAGSPRAARAVGRVMATNPIPIIIPCHRVIASGNRIGGFSAPSGLVMKRRLLSLEGVTSFLDAST